MCGIAGYVSLGLNFQSGQRLARMSDSIAHRGPDDEGFVLVNTITGEHIDLLGRQSNPLLGQKPLILETEFTHNVGFAHRRYSIIDLSTNGHQPMWSSCQSACITFNGEIYNYVELREELRVLGRVFRTGSDTEVFLQGYLEWGEKVFEKLNGFFAVAIYDARKRAVLLARDRLGKAHFYLARKNNNLIFWASEIKALIAGDCIDKTHIDPTSVSDFVEFGRRDRAGTFWTDVEDFPAAHFVWIDESKTWNPTKYWAIPSSRWKTSEISREEAALGLRDILSDALSIRMRADVPIAFELSGGMDSSSLVGLAAGHLGVKLKSFTIKFDEEHSNEEPFARAVAGRYPSLIDYRVIQQPKTHFWEEADRFVWLQEEPFHAPNLHTNQYIRRVMKNEGAHVVISGAAGDEMLGGYADDYFIPFLRHLLGKAEIALFFKEITCNNEISTTVALRRLIIREFLSIENNQRLVKNRSGESRLLNQVLAPNIRHAKKIIPNLYDEKSFHGITLANMSYRLMNYWLRSGSKSDYGIPIETRAPFLDYRVVEYCCQLPPELLISDGWHKHVLRLAVSDYLPKEVVWRKKKMGFPFPYREWLLASRVVIERNARGLDCPFINTKALFDNYDELVKVAPQTLWRLVSVILWWRRVVEYKEIKAT